MASGLLSIRQRIVHSEEMAFDKETTMPFPGTYNYFMRGTTTKPKHVNNHHSFLYYFIKILW